MANRFEDNYDLKTRVVYLGGPVNVEMSRQIIQALYAMSVDATSKPITLIINSGGGSVDEGMAIYDAISHIPCPVIGKVMGVCMSSALTILQACSLRLLSKNATLMLHNGEVAIGRQHTLEAIESSKQVVRDQKLFYELMSTRSGIPIKKIKRLSQFSTYFTATEAVAVGLADGILTLPSKPISHGKVNKRPNKKSSRNGKRKS